jgi:exoribonuclease R
LRRWEEDPSVRVLLTYLCVVITRRKKFSLTDSDYVYYEKEYVIKGRRHGKKFRPGDNLRVKVARINAFRSEIDFALVQH